MGRPLSRYGWPSVSVLRLLRYQSNSIQIYYLEQLPRDYFLQRDPPLHTRGKIELTSIPSSRGMDGGGLI